jgi:hypothetical protein
VAPGLDVVHHSRRAVVKGAVCAEGLDIVEVGGRAGRGDAVAREFGELDAQQARRGAAAVDDDFRGRVARRGGAGERELEGLVETLGLQCERGEVRCQPIMETIKEAACFADIGNLPPC